MNLTRIYADAEGESHFSDVEVELHDKGPIGLLSRPQPARSIIFRENEPGYDYDWHVAPARQYIILLDGAIELEVSDGASRIFRGGEILLMEDTHGKGHRTRHVEPTRRRSVFIVLNEQDAQP